MPRQAISISWSLEIPSDFERRETDDGFVIFHRAGHSIGAIVYLVDGATSEASLLDILDGFFGHSPEKPFEELVPGIVGYVIDTKDEKLDGNNGLKTLAAVPGEVAEINFKFERSEERALAIEIWRSCRIAHTPIADPALRNLWRAVQRGGGTQQEVEALRDQGRVDEALSLLRSALADPEPTTRATACLALEDLDDPTAAADLRPMLDDSDDMVVVRAADALMYWGEPAASLVPRLREILRQPEPTLPRGRDRIGEPCAYLQLPEAHCHAARILGSFGSDAAAARGELVNALLSSSAIVCAEAAKALAAMGEPSETYLPPLRAAMTDSVVQSSRERVAAAEALVELGEPTEPIIIAVLEFIQDDDWTAACWAIRLLVQLADRAASAVPALKAAVESGREGVAEEARLALAEIEAALPRLE